MRREKLIELAKQAGLQIEEGFLTITIRKGSKFVCIRDDGYISRDEPTELPRRITVKTAAQHLGLTN